MLTEERKNLIEAYVNEHKICSVAELCDLTASSESTIRRDLISLERAGRIERVHGGARSIKAFSRDIAQKVRFNLNRDTKIAIAKHAASYVKAGDFIFLDAGTSIYEMVQFLREIPDITVVTNGVDTAIACLDQQIQTILLGGYIKSDTHAVIGEAAVSQLRQLSFDISFVGTNGIDSYGLTTPDTREAAIKQLEIAQAQQVFVLADSSKIGQRTFAKFSDGHNLALICNKLTEQEKAMLPADLQLVEIAEQF